MNQSKIFKYSSRCAVILHSCIIDPDDRKSDYNAQLCKHNLGDAAGFRSKIVQIIDYRNAGKTQMIILAV